MDEWLSKKAEAQSAEPNALPPNTGVSTQESSPVNSPAGDGQSLREDALRTELDGILESMAKNMERITATTVMPKLKSAAGSKASCITEDCAEGVLWCRVSNTQPEKLTMKALSKRIGRWKKRQQGR
jgi:hypothetical protein